MQGVHRTVEGSLTASSHLGLVFVVMLRTDCYHVSRTAANERLLQMNTSVKMTCLYAGFKAVTAVFEDSCPQQVTRNR